MPTLNYKLDVTCDNCGKEQEINIPIGSPFVEYKKTLGIVTESGYHKNYGKDKHKTIKRCTECRTAMLVK